MRHAKHLVLTLLALLTAGALAVLPGLSQPAAAEPSLPSSTNSPTLPGAPSPTVSPTLPGAPTTSSPTTWEATGTAGVPEPTSKANLPGIDDPRWKKLTPAQQEAALAKAREAGGMAVCGQIPVIGDIQKLRKSCSSLVGPSFTVVKGAAAVTLCAPLTALMPAGINLLARFDCARVMVGLMEGKGWDAFKGTLLGEMGKIAGAVVKVAKFVANPMGSIDDLANATKDTAVGMSKAVLENAALSDSESLGSAQFRQDYAVGAGLGIVVAALMLLITFMQASRGAIDPDTLIESLVVRAPMGIFMILTGPAIGYALQQSVNGLSQGAASLAGTTMGDVISRLLATLTAATSAGIPGGQLAGIVLFIAVIVGAVSMLVTMIMVDFGLYMTSAILGVIFAMRINPLWRPKVRKVEAGWAAMLLMKPLFLLLLAFAFGFLKAKLNAGPNSTGFGLMVTIVTIAAVMITIGFAPFAIMRHAPILPGGNEMSESGTSGAGAMMFGAAGGFMSQAAMQRSAAGQAAGGGGGAGRPGSTGPAGPPAPPAGKPSQGPATAAQGTGTPQPPQRTPHPSPPGAAGSAGSRGAGATPAAGTRTGGTAAAASSGGAGKAAAAAGGPASIAAIAAMQGAQGLQALRAKSEAMARVGAPKMGEAEE